MSDEIKALLERHAPDLITEKSGRLVTDTTEFMSIGPGDVIRAGDRHYFVLRDEIERSFGTEDPKYWVKRCRTLETGERAILKLEFYESFPVRLGSVEIECFRSPRKEARILDLVRGDLRFMQGRSVDDEAGNNVRILDIVWGRPLAEYIENLDMSHEEYMSAVLPGMLEQFCESCRAIGFLHEHGENHGDIRRDHLFRERETGAFRWIDFDYTYEFRENPFGLDLFGLGNLLLHMVGKGFCTTYSMGQPNFDGCLDGPFYEDDFSLLFKSRLVNLRKVYPHVPADLNWVLMHFSLGTPVTYDTVDEMLGELEPCLAGLHRE
ncbi:MAG: serine/threonine protein kinase [Deltaproteobacteria bacterium]|nr:serine/threonine protein kinase [Deltaproteobacteria bacterium]